MDEKPITDRDNFPKPPEGEGPPMHTMFVPASALSPSAAYNEGCADGYRRAVKDFCVYAIIFYVVLSLTTRMYAAN